MTSFWQQPHGATWIADYRASIHTPVRQWLHDALCAQAPFTTVVDLGCHCGVLMPHILDASADAKVVGIDVSVEALQEAKRLYPNHTWVLASVTDWLPVLANIGCHADIMVSSSCLEHVEPCDIDQTLQAMVRVATRALVLQEVTTTPQMPEGPSLACGVAEWRYDYVKRFATLGWRCDNRLWLDVTSGRPAAVMTFLPENRNR